MEMPVSFQKLFLSLAVLGVGAVLHWIYGWSTLASWAVIFGLGFLLDLD